MLSAAFRELIPAKRGEWRENHSFFILDEVGGGI